MTKHSLLRLTRSGPEYDRKILLSAKGKPFFKAALVVVVSLSTLVFPFSVSMAQLPMDPNVTPSPKVVPRAAPRKEIEKEEASIPKVTSAPPQLWKPVPGFSERCRRSYLYRGQLYGCDSTTTVDGEGLRTILQATPEAIQELNAYQDGRRSIRNMGYIGTSGILLALLGPAIVRNIGDAQTSATLSQICTLSGLGLTGGAFVFGGIALRANEEHLQNAVRFYNSANPRDPIELQFSTRFSF